jgi:hypothetical protein
MNALGLMIGIILLVHGCVGLRDNKTLPEDPWIIRYFPNFLIGLGAALISMAIV